LTATLESTDGNRQKLIFSSFAFVINPLVLFSVAEPHQFYAATAPAPGKNFDAALAPAAPAPAPTLLYSKAKFLK
jgi:hypothetical protein